MTEINPHRRLGHARVSTYGQTLDAQLEIWDCALASSSAIITNVEDFAQRKVLTLMEPVVV